MWIAKAIVAGRRSLFACGAALLFMLFMGSSGDGNFVSSPSHLRIYMKPLFKWGFRFGQTSYLTVGLGVGRALPGLYLCVSVGWQSFDE